jgi:hypothetical protein
MKQQMLAAALASACAFGTFASGAAPALADGAASTRNILILGAGAATAITAYNHQQRAKREAQQETTRRQTAYRTWFYQKYGYYPTYDQFKQWYYQTYGVNPTS